MPHTSRSPRRVAPLAACAACAACAAFAALATSPARADAQGDGARAVRRVVTVSLWTPTAPGATLACAAPPAQDLAPLSDEFAGAGPLTGAGGRWRWFHEQYGWPTMLLRAGVDAGAGQLVLEPAQSGWFADYHAPFLFQTVAGDFDVTARVRASSVARGDGAMPTAPWSLVGLMARMPRPVTPQRWEPRGENWMFVTTGTAEAPGVPVFETKSTVNSGSNLKLRPARADWMELRIVRLREVFLLLTRMPGEGWHLRDRLLRRDVPWFGEMQVGLVAYTDGTNAPPSHRDPMAHNTEDPAVRAGLGNPDLRARVDWVRFRRPPVLRDVAPDWLIDHEVSEAALLAFLDGCDAGGPASPSPGAR